MKNIDIQRTTIRLNKEAHKKLRMMAFIQKTTMNKLIMKKIDEILKDEQKKQSVE